MKTPLIIIAALAAALASQHSSAQEKKPGPQPPVASLSDYAGRYGNKEITLRDGGLYYQRIEGRGAMLRATGKDSFALNEDAKLTFVRDSKGAVVELAIDWVSHEDERLKREPLAGGSAQPQENQPIRKRVPEQAAAAKSNEGAPRAGKPLEAQTLVQLEKIMTHLLETIYVSPEIGNRLAQQLKEKFEAGAYKQATTRAELAELLTRDLREWGNDRHLSVRYDPARSTEETILDPAEWAKQRALMFTGQGPGAGDRSRNPEMERMAARLKAENYHFRQAKTLEGNVGYFELNGFAPGEAAQQKAAETMASLAQSDAMIIDLRDCPGGSVEMINFLASYFFEPEPRVLMNRFVRPTGERIQSKTLAEIPGKRMPETDLYILVGPKTVSAGESFAYTLQQWGRAKIVGETTAGAGYNNVIIPLGEGLAFSISYGRPEHPRSGKGWEAVGVQPDIAVPVGDALQTAHQTALRTLIGKTTDERRKKELISGLQKIEGGPATADAEQQVRKLEREWLDAYERFDAAAIERILADEFTIAYDGGEARNKGEVLENVRTRGKSGSRPSKFLTEEVSARVDGARVILSGRLLQNGERAGKPVTMQFNYADTYVQRDGRWQVIDSRLTSL